MPASDIAVHGLMEWARLVVGLFVFLAPGLAAADRWLTGLPVRWLWAPVLSFSLLSLMGLALGFAFGLRVEPTTTWLLALVLAAAIARPRLAAWTRTLVRSPT